ncbi:MAG: hypothetical protein KKA73_11065 [Chloroflexi bacterium]|nr:hypothetical protein [Chloroflexota bacterium]MBU1748217.1 hypothetical protein [Chloroflexota bacterium]MBU1878848.1 hypothetical protein [Chloroflexota bacterium]
MPQDKSYRFRLPNELFEAAMQKAEREDLTLSQVLRRFLSAWVADKLETPPYIELEGETTEAK